MVPRDGYTLTEDDKTNFPLQLESEQPLLPKWRRVQDVVCGWRGMLAWACASTFMLIITSITLVSNATQPAAIIATDQPCGPSQIWPAVA